MIPTWILMGTSHITKIALQGMLQTGFALLAVWVLTLGWWRWRSRPLIVFWCCQRWGCKYDVMRCCFLSVASHSLVWASFAMLRWWSHSPLTRRVHVLISLMLNFASLRSWTFDNVCWLMEYHSSRSDSWHSEASVTLFFIFHVLSYYMMATRGNHSRLCHK